MEMSDRLAARGTDGPAASDGSFGRRDCPDRGGEGGGAFTFRDGDRTDGRGGSGD